MTLRLPAPIVERLDAILTARVSGARSPDVVIGGDYLRRWFIWPRNRVANAYLHEICRSDDDRALHDHPWWNVSVLLSGRYVEHRILEGGVNIRTERKAGEIVFRAARTAHRLEIAPGEVCCTLFLTGPNLRTWGFHCPRGWVPWREFTTPDGRGIGRGCGESEPEERT